MNTKSIIGIIAVVIIIGIIGAWLWKAPERAEAPIDNTQSAVTNAPSETPVSTSATPAATTPTTPPASNGARVISTNTVNGMKIEVTKEGTGPVIVNGQTAVMLYTGKLTDGSVFDATSKRNNTPLEFVLGSGMVIQGWDQGILGMKVGEQRTLTIPPQLAYGAEGRPPVIPQNATLVFNVTLVGIK
ncbi:MAG: FKBP-type peptidyl-prolyl cis-trans isomerase [Patescibacteria group bacterium]